METIYITTESTDGSFVDMDIDFLPEDAYKERLGTIEKEINGIKYKIHYTEKPLYFSDSFQDDVVYYIANSNKVNSFSDFITCCKKHHPEYLPFLSVRNIISTLNNMYRLNIDGERLYPDMKLHIYHKI